MENEVASHTANSIDVVDKRRNDQRSKTLSHHDKAIAVTLSQLGFHNKRIAALFDVNQGRITEALKDG